MTPFVALITGSVEGVTTSLAVTRYVGLIPCLEQGNCGLATVLGGCRYGTTLYPKNAAKDNSVEGCSIRSGVKNCKR